MAGVVTFLSSLLAFGNRNALVWIFMIAKYKVLMLNYNLGK